MLTEVIFTETKHANLTEDTCQGQLWPHKVMGPSALSIRDLQQNKPSVNLPAAAAAEHAAADPACMHILNIHVDINTQPRELLGQRPESDLFIQL